jgi:hypothetical protein
MGWDAVEHRGIYARVDAHHGERQKRGQQLWTNFCAEVELAIMEIMSKDEYDDIEAIQFYMY